MSNPEKRDERSMSDILASIRKIMAQEPALAMPPNPPRPSLNGVSGATLDLPREPELKLPAEKKPAESAAPSASPAPAVEAVSLDELLAETPRGTPPPAPVVKPVSADASPATGSAAAATPEWLFPQAGTDGTTKDKALPLPPAKEMEATLPAGSPAAPQSASLANKMESPADPKAGKRPAPPSAGIGPPAPRLGDLGSVVPSKLESAGSVPPPAVGPPASGVNGERSVLGPPLAGPLLGEPTRAPASSGPLPEVPGADALRRLIADVVPPSAHPGMSPGLKGPDASAARPPDAPKPETGTKPAPEIKAEAKAAPTLEPKKPDAAAPPAPAPVTAPAPRPVAAGLPPKPAAVVTAPAPKPAAAPAPEPQSETSTQTGPAKSAAPSAAKTIDETVVEMLRPLLREWLDKNMPRLIEPALKAEIEALRNVVAKEAKD